VFAVVSLFGKSTLDVRGVTYATLNVQGSCNKLCDTAPDPTEFATRNAAKIE
jgi:hypothetical protein